MNFLRQSTAATIKLGPFLDDTDGKTAEPGLTIAQADIRLSKNGGAFAQTNNAAGATHDEAGEYGVPLDTTDTNTIGRLKVLVSESGALPVWENFSVVSAEVYDAMFGTSGLTTRKDMGVIVAGTAQGGSASTIQLPAATSFTDDLPNGNVIGIVGGMGAGQARSGIDWTNTSPADTATVSPPWVVNPDNTSEIRMWLNSPSPIAASALPRVNMVAISDDEGAADMLEAILDGTGGTLTAALVGNITGNLSGSVGSTISLHVDAIAATVAAIFARTFHATKMAGLTFEELMALGMCSLLAKVSGLPTAPVFRNLSDGLNAISATTTTDGNRTTVTLTLTSVR